MVQKVGWVFFQKIKAPFMEKKENVSINNKLNASKNNL